MRPNGLADYLRHYEHQGGIVVSQERKFIYMKAPRTGGTSILRRVLEPAIPGIIHFKDTPRPFTRWKCQLTDEELEDYFIFSFVRNPWDRFVSISCYFELPVDRFVRRFDQYRRSAAVRSHSLPLYGYTHCGGMVFADFVGRFEHLQTDFEQVCARIGLRPTRLPHANRTSHDHYSRYFNAETKAAVASLYAKDIEAFDYRFEDPGESSRSSTRAACH